MQEPDECIRKQLLKVRNGLAATFYEFTGVISPNVYQECLAAASRTVHLPRFHAEGLLLLALAVFYCSPVMGLESCIIMVHEMDLISSDDPDAPWSYVSSMWLKFQADVPVDESSDRPIFDPEGNVVAFPCLSTNGIVIAYFQLQTRCLLADTTSRRLPKRVRNE